MLQLKILEWLLSHIPRNQRTEKKTHTHTHLTVRATHTHNRQSHFHSLFHTHTVRASPSSSVTCLWQWLHLCLAHLPQQKTRERAVWGVEEEEEEEEEGVDCVWRLESGSYCCWLQGTDLIIIFHVQHFGNHQSTVNNFRRSYRVYIYLPIYYRHHETTESPTYQCSGVHTLVHSKTVLFTNSHFNIFP